MPGGMTMALEDWLYPLRGWYEDAPQAVRQVAGRAFRALPERWRLGTGFRRFAAEVEASRGWDEAVVAAYQREAVRETLRAAAGSPFWRERLGEAGLTAEGYEHPEQLRAVRPVTKQDLIRERERMVSATSDLRERLLLTTGGSTGEPAGFYLQRGVSRAKEQAYLEAMWMRAGYRRGDRVAVLRGAVVNRAAEGAIAKREATRDWLLLSSSHLTADRVREYGRELDRFEPRHLHAYPSAALLLVELMEEAGLRLKRPLVGVWCGSEKLTAAARRRIESFFEAPVCHWYGHSERVVLAGPEPGSGEGLEFWPGYGLVEFGEADEQGLREVIGTSFHNRVMPLIRYRTGDLVRLKEGTEGTVRPVVVEVAGRAAEFLVSGTGRRVSLTAVNMHDLTFEGLAGVQFFQERAGEVELRYLPGPGWDEGRVRTMRDGVMRKLGDDWRLTLRRVERLEKTAAGKQRWLVSTMNQGAGE